MDILCASLFIFNLFFIVNGRPGEEAVQNNGDVGQENADPSIHYHKSITDRQPLVSAGRYYKEEYNNEFWTKSAQEAIKQKLAKRENRNVAKNVILFLGDGMSIPTISASRIYAGQRAGGAGEENTLHFETFPWVGLSKTYCVDHQVADSACSSTAYSTGVKANSGTLGVNAKVHLGDCDAMRNTQNHADSYMVWAQRLGKSTGIVTTTRITHASPGGSYAHTANRDWECDADVLLDKQDPQKCRDVAWQLVNTAPGNRYNVILGGGRMKLLPEDHIDEEGTKGQRKDGANLVQQWLEEHNGRQTNGRYVWDLPGLINVDKKTTTHLLGLFENDHMQYNLERDPSKEPSLADMTRAAIEVLRNNKNGYVLFVEGGRIDHAHHDAQAWKALDETEQFAEAVAVADSMTKEKDTLIVVTADHAHTMSLAGYALRGTDILGLNTDLGDDKIPYTTLSYANGPGYTRGGANGTRNEVTEEQLNSMNYKYPGMVPLSSESHGGDDVGVFCRGPWSHMCTGLYEQNVIPHILAYAACLPTGSPGSINACQRSGLSPRDAFSGEDIDGEAPKENEEPPQKNENLQDTPDIIP